MAARAKRCGCAIAIAVAALGCQVTTGFHASHSGGATPSAAVAHASGSGVTTSGLDPAGPAPDMSRTIPHDKLMALRGMTVEQATQRLRQLGFAGTINVYNHGAFMEGCTTDKVCFTQPQDGLELIGNIDLYMNAKLTIAPPPP